MAICDRLLDSAFRASVFFVTSQCPFMQLDAEPCFCNLPASLCPALPRLLCVILSCWYAAELLSPYGPTACFCFRGSSFDTRHWELLSVCQWPFRQQPQLKGIRPGLARAPYSVAQLGKRVDQKFKFPDCDCGLGATERQSIRLGQRAENGSFHAHLGSLSRFEALRSWQPTCGMRP